MMIAILKFRNYLTSSLNRCDRCKIFCKEYILKEFISQEKSLAWYDNGLQVKILILLRKVGYLFGVLMTEMLRATVILSIFAKKKYNQISYRLIVFGKCLSLVKVWNTFTWHILFMQFWSSFVIGQSLKHVHVTYSFHAILIFFCHWSKFETRSRDIFFSCNFDLLLINCLKFDFSLHRRNTVR